MRTALVLRPEAPACLPSRPFEVHMIGGFEKLTTSRLHGPDSVFRERMMYDHFPLPPAVFHFCCPRAVTAVQVDKLVQLLESPIFLRLRLQLLDVDSPSYPALLKSLYGILMLLPQVKKSKKIAWCGNSMKKRDERTGGADEGSDFDINSSSKDPTIQKEASEPRPNYLRLFVGRRK